jgi:hypothetical protein
MAPDRLRISKRVFMKNEIDVIRDFSQKLNQAGIQFMITGSMAMNYYAEPRMTRDTGSIEIWTKKLLLEDLFKKLSYE